MRLRQHLSAVDLLSATLVLATAAWISMGCGTHSPTLSGSPVQRQSDSPSTRPSITAEKKSTGEIVIADAEDSLSSPCEVEPEPGRPFEPELVVRGITGEITSFRYHSGMLAWIEDRYKPVLATAEPFGLRKVLSSPPSSIHSISLNGTNLFWVGVRHLIDNPVTRNCDTDPKHWSLDRATGRVQEVPGQGMCLVADDNFLYTTLRYPDRPNLGELVRFSLPDMEETALLSDVPLNVFCHVGKYVYLDRPQGSQSVPKDGSPATVELKQHKTFECNQLEGSWFFEILSTSNRPLKVPVKNCFERESYTYAPEAVYFLVGDYFPRDLPPGRVSTPPPPDTILKVSRLCAAPPIVIAGLRMPTRGRIVYGDGYVYWGEDGAIWRTPG